MANVFDELKARGFIAQMTHEDEIRDLLGGEPITFYTGYDATADSLHVGHLLQAIAMRHLQLAGHKPIVLIGGGTTMVGDPSGRTDMRKMMDRETIQANGSRFKEQLSRFIDFSEGKAIIEDNANWLLDLKYIEFLREVGAEFSVNRMLTAEAYKNRMEKGLSFLEFNYMIMQAYDFLVLYDKYDCILECGGDDQWSNILAGADLVRRKREGRANGLTFTLLTNSDGTKMGKTVGGAVWLDANKMSPYDFFQYWRNVEDAVTVKCLKLLTFLSLDEIKEYESLEGSEINKAKEVLAFEVTKLVHGEEEANKAMEAARSIFSSGAASENAPTAEIEKSELEEGIEIVAMLKIIGFASSNSEAKRLIDQGGVSVNDEKVDLTKKITMDDMQDGVIMVKKGKKSFHQIKAV